MPNLQIDISGLCVFAFDAEIKNGGSEPTEATLLMPKLTQSRALRHVVNQKNETLDQHFPLLQFRLQDQDVDASTRFPDFNCLPDDKGRMTTGCCLLHGDQVEILLDDKPLSGELILSSEEPKNKDRQTASEAEKASLWWMATLEDAFPAQKGKLKAAILQAGPAANQPILASVRLAQGSLRTAAATTERCSFDPVGSKQFNQFVATRFLFAVEFQKKVELRITRRDDNGMRTSLLALKVPSDGNLQIGLKSIEIDSLIGIGSAYSEKLPEADFEIYAELAEGVSLDEPLPFPRRTGPAVSGGVSGGSVCPPTAGFK
ncbi:MAG: hypothetical protein JF614_17375 [Acidobacteria bacterium]|nr:hypothetical protein [Acidobacteriota bacterium]